MPTGPEIVGILVAILVIWFVLKLAKIAIRVILFLIALMLLAGAAYYFFMR